MTRRGANAGRLVRAMASLALALFSGCSLLFSRPVLPAEIPLADLDRKFTVDELRADLAFAHRSIAEVHPRLRDASVRAQLDARAATLAERIDRPMTRIEFWPIAAELAAMLDDAHTSIGMPRAEWDRFVSTGGRVLPIAYVARDQQLCVQASYLGESGPPPGASLVSIDGITMDAVADEWEKLYSGKADFVNVVLATNLSQHLWRLGARAPFDVEYEGPDGVVLLRDVPGWTAEAIHAHTRSLAPAAAPAHTPKAESPANWSLQWLDGDVARIDFRSMRDMPAWKKFLERTFTEIRDRPARGLIVDLRSNGGGDSSLGDVLLGYLTDQPFRSCARKEWRASAQYRAFMKGHVVWWLRWLPLQWLHPVGRKMWGCDTGDIAVFENEEEQPADEELRYHGPWCVLIGPSTFSSATMLANTVEDYALAPLFGVETGGVPNTYGELYACDLPHTLLRLDISSAYFVRANGDGTNPHGVRPTHQVAPSTEDLARGRDAVLEAARAWLLEQRSP